MVKFGLKFDVNYKFKHLCYFCNCKITPQNQSYDHFIPRSRGGLYGKSNIVLSCKKCNSMKGNLYYNEFITHLLNILLNHYLKKFKFKKDLFK